MAADIDIINAALSKLGEVTITSVADVSPAGRIANRTYADIRDALLRQYPWNFATKRASLAADAEAPEWGYDYAFTLPAGCLRLIEVNAAATDQWRNEGGKVVTDLTAPLEIRYVEEVAVDQMDATFREALAARLAMEWAEPLSQTSTVVDAMASMYRNKLQVARTADGQEDRIQTIEANTFIDARW